MTGGLQRLEHADADACLPGEVGRNPGHAAGKKVEDAAARRRHPFALFRHPYEPESGCRLWGCQSRRHAHRHAQHRSRRRQRISGDPIDEPEDRFGQRRCLVQPLGNRFQLGPVESLASPPPDDADDLARTQGRHDKIAWPERHPLGHGIVVGTCQRQRQQNRNPVSTPNGLCAGIVSHHEVDFTLEIRGCT